MLRVLSSVVCPRDPCQYSLTQVRWGKAAHIIFFGFAILTNLLCSLSMLQGMPLPLFLGPTVGWPDHALCQAARAVHLEGQDASAPMTAGCVAAINALTGVNIFAQAFLIPIGVIFYACIGGLKATFTTSYIHTGESVAVNNIFYP